MKCKRAFFVISMALLALSMNSTSKAVDTVEINRVRNKDVLDSRDFQIIDDFVSEAVRELVNITDFTSISKVRTVIVSCSSSNRQSAQVQYSRQFYKSAYKLISSGLDQAHQLTPQSRRFKTILNLLILVDNLEDVRLAELGMKMLKDENKAIRYWAVHSVTNAGIIEQLNSGTGDSAELARRIVEQLKELVKGACPEIIALMANFAAELNSARAEDLLLDIAKMRIARYAEWEVDYPLLDVTVLKSLYTRMFSAKTDKSVIARNFAQLYSYSIQLYIENIKEGSFLSDIQRQQLASVLVETEKSCISALLGIPQGKIKRAVEREDYMALLQEHNELLGDETKEGKLAVKLNFDYGKAPGGNKRTAPLALPEQPKTRTSK